MNDTFLTLFQILKASLFTDEEIEIKNINSIFTEMKAQSVASIPRNWLRKHNITNIESWDVFCLNQLANWIRVMHEQDQAINLLEKNDISCVVIKGSAAAMAYPYPMLRVVRRK